MRAVTDHEVAGIPGWFQRIDVSAFRLFLEATSRSLGPGDLAELGAYRGKSAVLIGSYLRPGEEFTVIDLFGADATDVGNARETLEQYATLTRTQFEQDFRSIHGELPRVVQAPSSEILRHARTGTHRFVHIDASHLYDHVVEDIRAARELLKPDGVVVLDDYRTEHTPGVAAAAWQAVSEGLHPVLLTPQKLYATWGDTALWADPLRQWLARSGDCHEQQEISGLAVTRVWSKTPKVARYVPPVVLPTLRKLRTRVAARSDGDPPRP